MYCLSSMPEKHVRWLRYADARVCCRAFLDDGLRQVLQNPAIKHSLAKLDISNCRSISSAGLVIPPLVRYPTGQHSAGQRSTHALCETDQAFGAVCLCAS